MGRLEGRRPIECEVNEHLPACDVRVYLEDDFRAALGTERAREQGAPLLASQCSSWISEG